jgi:hypothetical protein
MKDLLKIVVGIASVGAFVWLYLKWRAFLDERGVARGRHDPRVEPPKVEIQSLFHGNTKDEDQV